MTALPSRALLGLFALLVVAWVARPVTVVPAGQGPIGPLPPPAPPAPYDSPAAAAVAPWVD